MSFPRIVRVQNSKLQPQLIQSGRVVHLDGTYSTSEGFTTYQVSVKTAANRLVTVARFVCSCDTTTSVAAGLDAVRRWCGTGPNGGDCLAPQYLVTDNSSVGTIVHSAQRTIGPIAMHGIVTVTPFLAFAVVACPGVSTGGLPSGLSKSGCVALLDSFQLEFVRGSQCSWQR